MNNGGVLCHNIFSNKLLDNFNALLINSEGSV